MEDRTLVHLKIFSNSAETSENPQIAVSGNNVYVVWEGKIESDTDIFIAVSTMEDKTLVHLRI